MSDQFLCVDLEDKLKWEGIFFVEVKDNVEEVSGMGYLYLLVFDLEDLAGVALAEVALDELFKQEEVWIEEILDIYCWIYLLINFQDSLSYCQTCPRNLL